jgi:hypothetical protein
MCDSNIKLIESSITSDDAKKVGFAENALQRLTSDLNTLSDTYWSIGYALAADKLLLLAEAFRKIPSEDEVKLENLHGRADAFVLQAVTNILIAFYLEKRPESQKIIDDVTKKQGLLSIMKNSEHFKDWPSAMGLLKDKIGDEAYTLADANAKRESEALLARFDKLHAFNNSSSSGYPGKMFKMKKEEPDQEVSAPTNASSFAPGGPAPKTE